MKFGTFEYMEWAKLAPDPSIEFNLAGSGIHHVDPALIRPDYSRIRLHGPGEYGVPSIRERIAARYDVPPEHVLPVAGTSLGVFLAFAALLVPGDEILLEFPTYEPILKVPEALGVRVRRFDRGFSRRFELDPGVVEEALSPRTRLVALCDLHNPSGRRVSPAAGSRLLEMAAAGGFTLFVDEVYRDFLEDEPVGSLYRPGLPVVVTSSLTKVYGLGGLRAGWILGPPAVVRRASRIMDFLHVVDPYPVVPFQEAGFDHAGELRERTLDLARRGTAVVKEWMAGRPDMAWVPPDGGLCSFPRLPAGVTGTAVSEILKRDEKTLVVPGRFFEDDSHIRIGVGSGPEVVTEGLARLGRVLDRLAG